jgi:predicted dehydrogenase
MSLRVGLVGCGRWGTHHLATLQTLQEEGLVARLVVCDINPSQLNSVRADGVYNGFERMLESETLDAVAIVTPPETHAALLHLALAHELPALVEKPFTDNHGQAVDVFHAFPATAVVVVGYLLRHHAGLLRLKTMLEKDALGDVHGVRYVRRTPRSKPMDADPITTLAVHGLDLVTWLFQSPLRTFERAKIERDERAATVFLSNGSEHHAEVDVAWEATDEQRLVEVTGDQGSVSLDFGTGAFTHRDVGGVVVEELEVAGQPLEAEWRWFLNVAQQGQPCIYPSMDSLLDQSEWLHLHSPH